MPLPASTSKPWPPAWWADFQADIELDADWYSGNAGNLDGRHGAPEANPTARSFFPRKKNAADPTTSERRLHIPAATDIAATGADLLFGTTPTFTVPGAKGDKPEPYAEQAQARLDELVQLDGWSSTLLEGAEIAGGLGGVFLKPVVDPALADHPILTVVHPDAAVPVFRHGRLAEVTFWTELEKDAKGNVWRHLEYHGPGVVEHGLYLGDSKQLGARQHLSLRDETLALATNDADIYGGGALDLAVMYGITWVLASYVPNALPNRKHRKSKVGRADFAGCYGLLNELDETWSSWVRDIRLAKARLVVSDEYLDSGKGRGKGSSFDLDREIFSPLPGIEPKNGDGITLVQFKIRNEEHEATCRALFQQIVHSSGYSPQSFGLEGNGAQITATEVDAREGRSEATTGRKQEYWRRPLCDQAYNVLILDAKEFGSGVMPVRPTMAFPEPQEDPLHLAQTLQALSLARAASTETMVRMQHPEWAKGDVEAEVARILGETTTGVADPFEDVP